LKAWEILKDTVVSEEVKTDHLFSYDRIQKWKEQVDEILKWYLEYGLAWGSQNES
jgi:hypothetical protein